jgi:hypothetical protein
MIELVELIQATDKLCASLDKAAACEMKYGNEICHELERMTWSTLRMANDLKKIREYQIGE